jgi:A/G-specific adenine glycosylase
VSRGGGRSARAPGAVAAPAPARREFRRRLLAWYRRHGRALPWRRTRDPYRILVSEVMLQQTQVSRVLPKYREWLRRYPSLKALAGASASEVREAWYPLGYNIRPLRLRGIARTVVRRHGGRLPRTRDGLLALKGIGAYTAGAVLSFAFGEHAAILDTNVRRVLRRVWLGEGRPVRDRALWDLAGRLLPRAAAYDFNQALMDLGATVCTARKPRCASCPLARLCASYPLEPRRVEAVVDEQHLAGDAPRQ